MSLGSDIMRRPPREWAIRLVLATIVMVLGYYGVTFSIAHTIVDDNPALAYKLAPYDGRITAAYASSLATVDATPQDRTLADTLAARALRLDRTAVAAAATLGVNADVRGDKAMARRYFTYAQTLSRRDVRTQLWMIEDAVGRGDVPAALHQYDITLRVFPELEKLLYPVLALASGEPAIRTELAKTLVGKPIWGESFINFVAVNGPDPRSTVALFTELRRVGGTVPQSARASTVNALIAKGEVDAAWSYYATGRPGVDRRRSRDPHFAASIEPPSQLDWVPLSDGGLTTGIQGGIFDFAAPASVGGVMLQQVQMLSPGSYRLTGHSLGIEQAENALPYWTLRCRDGRELGRIEVPNSATANGIFAGTFSVPPGCPMQTLLLTARPSDAVSGLSGQFDRIELVPAIR